MLFRFSCYTVGMNARNVLMALCLVTLCLSPSRLRGQDDAGDSAVVLRFDYSSELQFRRTVQRDLAVEYTVAGDTRKQADSSRVAIDYTVTPAAATPDDGAGAALAVRYQEIKMWPADKTAEPVTTVISAEGVRMVREGQTLRKSSLRNSPYDGLSKWIVKRRLLPTGLRAEDDVVPRHEFYSELYEVSNRDYLLLPDAPVKVGDTWARDLRIWPTAASDSLHLVAQRVPVTYELKSVEERAGVEQAAHIVFKGGFDCPQDETPTVNNSGATLVYSVLGADIAGEAWFDVAAGRLMSSSLTVSLRLRYDMKTGGAAAADSSTVRTGTLTITELALKE